MAKSHLLRNILIISIAAVMLLPLFTTFYLSPSFTRLLTEDTEKQASSITAHIATMLIKDKGELKQDSLPEDFPKQVAEVQRDFNVMKLKVFSPSGEVIYSTDPEDIGDRTSERYLFEIVAQGKPYSNVVKKQSRSLEGQFIPLDVVETYVPLLSGNTFIGAIEIYFDITAKKEKLDTIVSRSYTIVFVLAVILLSSLIMSSVKAHRAIIEKDMAKEEIRKAFQMTRNILEKSPLGIVVSDSEGTIDYVNPAMLHISGDTYDQFIGLNIYEIPTYITMGLPEKIRAALNGEPFFLGPVEYTSHVGGKTTIRNFVGMPFEQEKEKKVLMFVEDITESKEAEQEREDLIVELKKTLSEVKALSGLLPICAKCKKIRDDKGYWQQVEQYIGKHSEAEFSHGLCPDCAEIMYPDYFREKGKRE